MSFFRHLQICNDFDPERYLPFVLDGTRLGFVRRAVAKALADYPETFRVNDRAVELAPGLAGAARITASIGEAADGLVRRGLVGGKRGEMFAVTEGWGGQVLFELDRGIVPFFGTRSYGVHLNGLCPGEGEPSLWIGRRALDKKVAPGKLDNLVAGGISAGYGAQETLVKEAGEEAAIDPALAASARPAGAVMYRMSQPDGMRDDVLFLYDIVLPAGFEPRNTDGEIESFHVLPIAEALRLVAETDQFKFNVNLVLIDLALRHGWIAPEHPEYLDLVVGLRGAQRRGGV